MPTITIDGQTCAFDGKQTVLQVALDHGIEIPHYCYHPGLSIVASCRICLAEVAQPNPRNDNKVELIPKLLPTCQTLAVDGMVVHTDSPKAVANQKAVMEYLLINHPLDCPVCDQAGECYLQDYSYQYGRSVSRFEEDKIKQPKKDLGPHVLLYSDRCIMCSRCVRFTREVTGTNEIGVFGRGAREQIDVFPGKPLDNPLSANVVDICPVGALLDKDFLFTQRVWLLKQTPSIDGITASGDNLWLEHNEGRLYRVKPRANPDVNRWWITDEVRYGWQFVHDEKRLTRPIKNQYNDPIEVDWDRAVRDAKDLLVKAAAEGEGSVALMVSPMLTCEEAFLLASTVRALDSRAVLAVGPVPVQGQDQTLPGGFVIRSEKCPNRRGVRRVLERVADGQAVLDYEALIERLGDKTSPIKAVLATGNYPSAWATKELLGALRGKSVVLLDTLPNDLTPKADVVLPACTWAEKAGTFENADGRLQAFDRAIPPLELTRPEGRIALDLLAAAGLGEPTGYDPASVRQRIGGELASDVHLPEHVRPTEADMQFVAL